ncbi:unnamed protein product (macronuclear) [Paramecium tetraurelia]|uniref:Cyclic nucleotide-binding domain-containing protein n=1 Tax=Paramecium tetraurelia TaxID=5888 RepID=A0CAH5_PARTE|nr:uncharacterized protein GSPATT00036572001 [Paramecium tetraurelia]CAK67792.1 unnamed protein product [Paramecium tetraurelia]|eukprot:XP_001435189.1 hypothetical protein (macronuclear) [Paramecium tetraurelia strain d4-2]
MTVVNQHQLQVRKPSDAAQELLRSPPTTSVTPQIASDRPPQSEMQDLLLIKEEPSNIEQSVQISDRCKGAHQGQKNNLSQQSILIDEKPQHSYSDVQWSRLMSLKTVNTHPSFQLNILGDKAAVFDQSNSLKKCFHPKKQNLYYHTSDIIYCLYLCFFITQLLINLQDSFKGQHIYQILLIIFQVIHALNQIIFEQYENGEIINSIQQLIQNYLKKQSIFDIITSIPVIFALSFEEMHFIQLLHIIRLWKLRQQVIGFELIYGKLVQYTYYILEFHFVQFIALTILQFNHNRQLNFYDEFIVLFYKSNESNAITYLIRLLILIYYCYCIFRFTLKESLDVHKLSLSYDTKQQIKAYINKLNSQQSEDMNFLSHLPQKYVDDVKFQRYFHLLQKMPIFKCSFSESTLRQICSLIQEYTYIPNQIVLMQQTSNQHLFMILSGEVQISQKKEGSSNSDFKIKIIGKDSIFNNQAFFKNTYSNINATSIGYSQIAQLDLESFLDCIKSHYQERQKYKMMVDQIVLYEVYSLCQLCCYVCGKFHDIDECDHVHYVPKKQILVQYIQSNDQQIRRNYFRPKTRQKQNRLKSYILKIEEAALQYQQQNFESDNTDENKKYQDEVISIQQPYLGEMSHPYSERQSSLQQSQQTPKRGSQNSMRDSLHSLQQQQQQQQHQLMDIPNISPVQYIQQPPSGISHSSYGQLFKDVSINRKNFNGSSDKNSSGNVFSLPYSSNGSKNTPNNMISKQEKDELISIQMKKAKLQDSVYYHQKRIQNQMDNCSQNTHSKYQKYHTTQPQQQQTKTIRSDRKSNSCISESEKGEYQVQQQQEVQPSRYGIQSSKFTGETAKQFMRNPLEMPNLEFYQSFEKSNQFSDYFPQHNIDQAIESYKQYQQSRSSAHK